MWYEMLPPLFLIGLIPVAPQYWSAFVNQLILGNPMRRNMTKVWDRHMFTRDGRIDGAPWKHRGLENIPDD
ncbi:uncharacterized protein LOC112589906 [Harpegnathos saltator]|uniref:Uncharacterized protein n=1 Tax=Harpegnathos saltator TaxID=610380 RepID=E2C4M9_HARSA|nr:uncharacterized protein LOC112589906 [Harpegnathos saltator]EFN77109.1 hypothetical protein EAI_14224 [Harpegnathos saltator]